MPDSFLAEVLNLGASKNGLGRIKRFRQSDLFVHLEREPSAACGGEFRQESQYEVREEANASYPRDKPNVLRLLF
jgi:hypothetical protein